MGYALIGWPSLGRIEESHRHVQRVYATLGAKASQIRYTFNGVLITTSSNFINTFYVRSPTLNSTKAADNMDDCSKALCGYPVLKVHHLQILKFDLRV